MIDYLRRIVKYTNMEVSLRGRFQMGDRLSVGVYCGRRNAQSAEEGECECSGTDELCSRQWCEEESALPDCIVTADHTIC